MSNEKHVRNSFYNGSRIDDIEANENRGPAGPQGLPGFSPRASVTLTEKGARIIITDKNGTTYADITNGRNGVDGNNGSNGISPIAEVAEVEDGAQLTVTDNRGTTTALIRNGKRGERGKQGIQGPAGADGFSPTVEVTEITNGHTVTITDKDGLHSFEVTNGKDGQNGQNGENGQNGSDGAAATISIGNVETLPEGSSAYVRNTGNDNAAVFDFGIPQGIQGPAGPEGKQGIQGPAGPAGPSNVIPIITEGTAIADINGTTIYAPEGGSDSDYIKVDYSTVTAEELKNYVDNNKLVYIKYSSNYMPLTYYSRKRTGTPPNTYYVQTYVFTGFTSYNNGLVAPEYTITYNESTTDVTRNYTSKYITSQINNTITNVKTSGATISRLGNIHNEPFYSGFIDVTNVTSLATVSNLYVVSGTTSLGKSNDNSFELYRLGQYNVDGKYQICRMYCTNLERSSSGGMSITALKFKGEIVLDNKIIILTNTLTSSGWSGQVAKQILLSDIS